LSREDVMDERFGREGFGRRYEDDERRFAEGRPADYESRGYYQPARSRGDYARPDDRGFFDRAGDEVRSWFGDEEAERRRRRDELEARRRGWRPAPRWGERGTRSSDYVDDREWARQWGYLERPYDRRGMAEERPWWEDRWGDSGFRSERESPGRRSMGYDFGPGAGGDVWMSRGPHTGRGPKGYQRSDERIKEDLCERLCEHGELDAREIEVVVVNREVTLQGSVTNRTDKRLAEDIADSVSGVSEVHNQLRVDQGTEPRRVDWRDRAA
jgi:BON domain-containing protein